MTHCMKIAAALVLAAIASVAAAHVKIGLLVSATGPTTAIGIPQQNTWMLLPARIGDATVEYIQLDDGGDTTPAVQKAKKLLQERNVDALIGPSTSPNALAILDLIADSKGLLLAVAGAAALVFQNRGRTCAYHQGGAEIVAVG